MWCVGICCGWGGGVFVVLDDVKFVVGRGRYRKVFVFDVVEGDVCEVVVVDVGFFGYIEFEGGVGNDVVVVYVFDGGRYVCDLL